jgi:hypothetical protein
MKERGPGGVGGEEGDELAAVDFANAVFAASFESYPASYCCCAEVGGGG